MNVQFLIGCYAVICLSMIAYNCFCIVFFRQRDEFVAHRSAAFRQLLADPDALSDPARRRRLSRRLRGVNELLAFEDAMRAMRSAQPQTFAGCRPQAAELLRALVPVYARKPAMQQACFPHVLAEFGVPRLAPGEELFRFLFRLLQDSSLYSRENAMRALYASGRVDMVLQGLRVVDESETFYNMRLITEGLLAFDGDREALIAALWEALPGFRSGTQVAVLNFIRFGSGNWADPMLRLLRTTQDTEVTIACLRYFGRYPSAEALPLIRRFAQQGEEQWEVVAVAMTVLASYPGEETVELLKQGLYSRNWYVRSNAAESLSRLRADYQQLRDVLEGPDPYARQILRFQLEHAMTDEERRNAD